MNTLSVRRRSPFDAPFDQQFNRQFDALVRGTLATPVTTGRPAAEVERDGDDAVVRLDLPGLAAEDVTVEVDGDTLVVRGERRDTRSEERDVRRSEVRYGAFRRAFTLPAQVTADAVSAGYDAGVLTVRVAGAHTAAQPTRITVSGAARATAQTAPAEATSEVTAAQ